MLASPAPRRRCWARRRARRTVLAGCSRGWLDAAAVVQGRIGTGADTPAALALKGNQGPLHEDMATYRDNPPESAKLLSHQQVGKGHGRVEKRTATVCHDIDWLLLRHDWPRLWAVGKVVAERRLADGAESADTRYYLLSATPEANASHRSSAPTGDREQPALGAPRVDRRGPRAATPHQALAMPNLLSSRHPRQQLL